MHCHWSFKKQQQDLSTIVPTFGDHLIFCPHLKMKLSPKLASSFLIWCFWHASSFVSNSEPIKPVISWPKNSSFVRLLRAVALIFRLDPNDCHYCEATHKQVKQKCKNPPLLLPKKRSFRISFRIRTMFKMRLFSWHISCQPWCI